MLRALLGLRMLVLLAFAVFFGVPLAWLVLAPTKTGYQLLTSSPFSFGSLHNVRIAWNQLDSFGNGMFRRWLENSLLYAFGGTALTLLTSIPAGYGLAHGRFPGRQIVLWLTIVVMIVPANSLVLPIFLELNSMHLIGRSLSVILPFSFFPFGVFLAYIYYATALPPGLLDAARLDGCGELQAFLRVAVPLAKPIVALIVFFSFVADWTNFFLPYVVLVDSSQYPVQVGLSDILNGSRPEVALATIVAALPVAVVLVLCQRALVRGLVR
jgi:multiple sugar transport system permease protein